MEEKTLTKQGYCLSFFSFCPFISSFLRKCFCSNGTKRNGNDERKKRKKGEKGENKKKERKKKEEKGREGKTTEKVKKMKMKKRFSRKRSMECEFWRSEKESMIS